MNWSGFNIFAITALLFWMVAAICSWRQKRVLSLSLSAVGTAIFFSFIAGLWFTLNRPPMRTMGETRLWYVFFISLAGIIVYFKWHYKWILSFSFVMELVFTCINIFKPDIHNKTLMPALQSPWFAPHVTVYMFAYALFGAVALVAVYILFIKKGVIKASEMEMCDNLTGVGLAFMTIGMLFGAVWAEQAWGHYWAWDPKETWAAATWFSYLVYIHLRSHSFSNFGSSPSTSITPVASIKDKVALVILIISFLLLQMCWWGINYLPSAQGTSVHTYNM